MSPKWFSSKPSGPPNAKIELTAQKTQYCLGEQISGTVKISSDEEFLVNQAVVCLTCNESLKKTRVLGNQYGTSQTEYWDSGVIYGNVCKLFGAARIPQGFTATYPYALTISAAAMETLYSVDHFVKWFLNATIEVNGRPNIQTITYETQVMRPQISQSAPAIVKEVEREVVLIPCKYCSSLMPQAATFCPNCGARRKT
jgi:hypothetical protein